MVMRVEFYKGGDGRLCGWRRGEATPAGPALDAMYVRWQALADGDRLVVEWPVHRLPDTKSQGARRAARRRPAWRAGRGAA